jgi:hypothetical protein
VKTEDDPLDSSPPAGMRETVAAMNHLDRATTAAGGIALRYVGFYGDVNFVVAAVRAGTYPIVGDGSGLMSFVHLEDAAAATALAIERNGPRSTTSGTTSPLRSGPGFPSWHGSWVGDRPAGSRGCWPGWSPVRRPWSWPPRRAAPPTHGRSASLAGRFATRAGATASRQPAARPRPQPVGSRRRPARDAPNQRWSEAAGAFGGAVRPSV